MMVLLALALALIDRRYAAVFDHREDEEQELVRKVAQWRCYVQLPYLHHGLDHLSELGRRAGMSFYAPNVYRFYRPARPPLNWLREVPRHVEE